VRRPPTDGEAYCRTWKASTVNLMEPGLEAAQRMLPLHSPRAEESGPKHPTITRWHPVRLIPIQATACWKRPFAVSLVEPLRCPLRVRLRNTRSEQMFSGHPPITDIRRQV
jgi:hypothetical protein